jgi:hypothetical protein
VAPLNHGSPRAIFRRLTATVREKPVRGPLGRQFPLKAAAALRSAVAKRAEVCDRHYAAVATTTPFCWPRLNTNQSNQTSEPLAGNIESGTTHASILYPNSANRLRYA